MPDYRIYAIGPDGHFTSAENIECADDQEAIRKAQQAAVRAFGSSHGLQLRQGFREAAAACALAATDGYYSNLERVMAIDAESIASRSTKCRAARFVSRRI